MPIMSDNRQIEQQWDDDDFKLFLTLSVSFYSRSRGAATRDVGCPIPQPE